MKIGQLVKYYMPKIIEYCEKEDLQEISRLKDDAYSKQTFNINFSFWLDSDDVKESKRYWSDIYMVGDESLRASSQWFSKSRESFEKYLIDRKIATEYELEDMITQTGKDAESKLDRKINDNSRYKGAAIGNAQNAVIRNILSKIGDEAFNEKSWVETKEFFGNKCAYCGCENKLVIEHAIPINRSMLGEHRLGNLVPSCNTCNSKKASLSYSEFLKDDQQKIDKIEEYMSTRNYNPLGNNPKSEIIAELLEKAYLETAEVAKRYVSIIELVNQESSVIFSDT